MLPDTLQLLFRDYRGSELTLPLPVVTGIASANISAGTSLMQDCLAAHDVQTINCVVEYQDDHTEGETGNWARTNQLLFIDAIDSNDAPVRFLFSGPKNDVFDANGDPIFPWPTSITLFAAWVLQYCVGYDGATLSSIVGYGRLVVNTPIQRMRSTADWMIKGEPWTEFYQQHGFDVVKS